MSTIIAPIYVFTFGNMAEFIPGNGLPIIDSDGTYITDQSILDAVISSAATLGVLLHFSATGTDTGGQPFDPLASAVRVTPQTFTSGQQAQARANIGAGTGGGGGGGTVTTVNHTSPDGAGDIELTPAILGADAAGSATAAQNASLQKTQNLADLNSPGAARTNLGIATAALLVVEVSGSYPNRPAWGGPVIFVGVDTPAGGGTTAGGAGAVNGMDLYFKTVT